MFGHAFKFLKRWRIHLEDLQMDILLLDRFLDADRFESLLATVVAVHSLIFVEINFGFW